MRVARAVANENSAIAYAESLRRAVASSPDLRDYALGQLAKTFFWVASDALTVFVLIRQGGYAPVAAGWIFLAGLLWNAVCDVAVGYWVDWRVATRRTMTWILAAAIPVMGGAFAASLLVPSAFGAWTVFATLLFRSAFAVYDVPHNAMMAQLSRTPALGVRVATVRAIMSSVASLVVGLLAAQLLDTHSQEWAVPLLLLMSVGSMLLMLPFVRSVSRLEASPEQTFAQTEGIQAPIESVSLTRLCIVTAIGTVALATLTKGILHLDVVEHPWAANMLLLLMIGGMVAIGLVGPATSAFGCMATLRGAYVVATVLVLALPLAVSMNDVVPLALILLIGVAQGVQLITSWLTLARVVRSSELELRRRASRFGIYTMVTKVARGTSGLVLGLLLSGAVMDSLTLWHLAMLVALGTTVGAFGARNSN